MFLPLRLSVRYDAFALASSFGADAGGGNAVLVIMCSSSTSSCSVALARARVRTGVRVAIAIAIVCGEGDAPRGESSGEWRDLTCLRDERAYGAQRAKKECEIEKKEHLSL